MKKKYKNLRCIKCNKVMTSSVWVPLLEDDSLVKATLPVCNNEKCECYGLVQMGKQKMQNEIKK